MLEEAHERLTKLYQSPQGEIWDRIEDGLPDGYLERNVVSGRQRAMALLLRWMTPVSGRRVLDLGCGRGHFANRLAQEGAQVTAIDLLPRFETHQRTGEPNPAFMIGDGFTLAADEFYDDILVREVLEDYQPKEIPRVLAQLVSSQGKRVFLILRVAGPFSKLWRSLTSPGFDNTLDPLSLLDWIQQNTPFRLTRQETVNLRNYRVWVVQLVRASTEFDTPLVH